MRQEMPVGLSSMSIPVIFRRQGLFAKAFTPNLINFQVVGGMPYFPKQQLTVVMIGVVPSKTSKSVEEGRFVIYQTRQKGAGNSILYEWLSEVEIQDSLRANNRQSVNELRGSILEKTVRPKTHDDITPYQKAVIENVHGSNWLKTTGQEVSSSTKRMEAIRNTLAMETQRNQLRKEDP
jgi:hypothetical protein